MTPTYDLSVLVPAERAVIDHALRYGAVYAPATPLSEVASRSDFMRAINRLGTATKRRPAVLRREGVRYVVELAALETYLASKAPKKAGARL